MSLPCTRCGLLVGVDQARCPRCGASLAQPSDVTTPVASPGTRSSTQVLRRVLIGGVAGLIALGLAFTAYAMLNRTDPASRAAASNAAVDPATGPSASAQPPTPTKAPFAGASLLTATVPAYCQLPETRLVDGRVPASIAGDGNGTLILEGPAAPVFLDLDGDKDPETVAAYSCEASGVAAGAHWPEMLVIYGADGAIKGTVGLGDHKLVGDTTTLEALAVSGNGVQVEWLDNNRLGTTMGRTGTLTWAAGAPDLSANAIGTTVTVVGGHSETAFMSPSGNILCDFGEQHVFCIVFKHDWVATPAPVGSLCEIIDYGDYIELEATGPAKYSCTGGVFGMSAWVNNQPPGVYGRPAWFVEGTDPIVTRGEQKYYALSYGRSMKAGSINCHLTEDGLTCENGTGGFFVNRSTVALH